MSRTTRALRIAAAYVVAPFAAAPALYAIVAVGAGDSPLPAIIAPLTFHGLMVTMMAAVAVAIGGTAMLLVSPAARPFQGVLSWTLVGFVLGMLAGVPFIGLDAQLAVLGGGLAGAACAAIFRLIAGRPAQRGS